MMYAREHTVRFIGTQRNNMCRSVATMVAVVVVVVIIKRIGHACWIFIRQRVSFRLIDMPVKCPHRAISEGADNEPNREKLLKHRGSVQDSTGVFQYELLPGCD